MAKAQPAEQFIKTETGATRGAHVAGESQGNQFPVRYELISPIILRGIARGFGFLVQDGGSDWHAGRTASDLYNQLVESIGNWQLGCRHDGYIERALAIVAVLVHLEESPGVPLPAGDSDRLERFDLIPVAFLRRLSQTYGEGSLKYGDHNWWKGFKEKMLLNHGLAHFFMWSSKDKSEDHLCHGAWNLGGLIHFQETRPDLLDLQLAIEEHQPYADRESHPLDQDYQAPAPSKPRRRGK